STSPRPPSSILFPYTTLFRSNLNTGYGHAALNEYFGVSAISDAGYQDVFNALLYKKIFRYDSGLCRFPSPHFAFVGKCGFPEFGDRKSTRLNFSHVKITYAVF